MQLSGISRPFPNQGEAFESFYGADGDWTKLSRRSRSFLGSSFLKDLAHPERYLLVEYSSEMLVYEKHLADFDAELHRLEEVRERFVMKMEALGVFTGSSARPRRPDLVAAIGLAQLGVVGSSIPRAASSVVEHLTFNQGVPGSIPGRPTTKPSANRTMSLSAAKSISPDLANALQTRRDAARLTRGPRSSPGGGVMPGDAFTYTCQKLPVPATCEVCGIPVGRRRM